MYKHFEFKNKARLITIPFKDSQAVTLFFLFGVGSRYEHKEINGASHFIEHLMFKGTKKRPTTLDISRDLDRVGAEFNAMTSKDYTGYYIKINREKFDLALDILSDMILNSKFAPAEINKERGVVIEEINMYNDNPMMSVESLFEELVHSGSTLGWDIAGPAAVIRKVSRQELLTYKNEYYQPGNLVVAVAGNINDDVKKKIEEKLINKLPANKTRRAFKPFAENQKEPRLKIKFKQTKQVQLAMGFPAFGYQDDRIYALHLLTIILGGNMSSRLFVSVREKRGLAYFVRCYPNFYQDTGNFYIQSGLDASRLDKAIEVMMKELKKIKKVKVSEKELIDAKEFIKGKSVLTLEDTSHLTEYYAKQWLLAERLMTPEQKMKKYEAVTTEAIRQVAKDIFVAQKFNLAIIGPVKGEKRLEKLINL